MTGPIRPFSEATREARGHQRSGRPAQPPELQAAGLGRRPPARAVTTALTATMLVALAGLVLTVLEWSSLATSDAVGSVGAVAGAIAYAALGALIVRRAGNLVGWFMLVEGAATAVMTTGSAYAIFGVKAHPGTLPAAAAVGALAEAVFVIVAMDLAAVFLVFPSGRLPSPRWRPAALAGLVLTGLSVASFVVSTRRVALPAPGGISLVYPNPLAVRFLQPVTWLGTLNGLALLFPVLLGGALVSLALRYRRGDRRLRQQMKWLGLAIAGCWPPRPSAAWLSPSARPTSRCRRCRTPSPRFSCCSPSRWPWRSRSYAAGCSTST